MTRRLIADLPNGTYRFEDFLDDDGINPEPLKIVVAVTIQGEEILVDFDKHIHGGVSLLLFIETEGV